MTNSKAAPKVSQPPLADGQVWQMAELNLQVGMVGKLLVHYKLAKPNAVRIPNLVGSIATIQKYLKKEKAVLLPAVPVAPVAVKKKAPAAKKPVAKKTAVTPKKK